MTPRALTLSTISVPTLTVERFYRAAQERLDLELVAGHRGLEQPIAEPALHRPGLALTGFYEHFAYRRPQVFGRAETAYLQSLGDGRLRSWETLLEHRVPCCIFCCIDDNNALGGNLLASADALGIPLLTTRRESLDVFRSGALLLHELTAPRAAVHGTFVDVDGVGVLLEGPPGIGKSETALGLIRRGHALIADDMTHLTLDTHGALRGAAPSQMRGFMEIRGLGLLSIPTLFGITAVRPEARLDLIITLRRSASEDGIDRDGTDVQMCEILGLPVRRLIIPVAAGRDFVNVVETAAATYKMRASGIDAAAILDAQVVAHNQSMEHHHE